ncbi:hypothetical protein PCL_00009 [Purpureocillium lilacinum]|uniref:DUF7068 domain-containing protein n=1 Tax=Purpureocillium lilacinum TaxID=33203 RepID=A0A2U3DP97_PURLI|nr:hypothetical protein PCL_00009 [Purpureocillium lilacinum]
MVYDFTHDTKLHRSWAELFDRLLWVPLRRLKGRSGKSYNLDEESHRLVGAIWDATRLQKGSRTLFILDGLDEVSREWSHDDAMHTFLETLLNQPNVIITSRPAGTLLTGLRPVDLELETIGFYPDQVETYLRADPKMRHRVNEIQSFLQKHWLIQGLVRIPIQLDALCYTWDDFDPGTVPDTITGIYEAIAQRLWRKDAVRLGKRHNGQPVTHSHVGISDVEDFVEHETRLLEGLAFTGLVNDVIEFTPKHRTAISGKSKHQSVLLDKTLPGLSFLRTSDPLSNDCNRNYHFLHLTFQEYFAARHFVRHWSLDQPLACLDLRDKVAKQITPVEFLRKQKYSAHHDVFWRFVAGLLSAADKGEPGPKRVVLGFFHAIEQDPLDILGPTHQRLVMHCLSEVSTENKAVRLRLEDELKLEERLRLWLLFECTFHHKSHLAREVEFPEQALRNALREGSDDVRTIIIESLQGRGVIPASINELVLSWLHGDASQRLKNSVLNALGSCRTVLSDKSLVAVVQRPNDYDGDVRRATVKVLEKRPRLSNDNKSAGRATVEELGKRPSLSDLSLAAVVQRLNDDNSYVRRAAVEVLGKQKSLSGESLAAVAQRLNDDKGYVRTTAVEVLGKHQSLSNECLAAVVQRLNDDKGYVRRAAVEDLGKQKSLSGEILAAVLPLLNADNRYVRRVAVEVLEKQPNLSDWSLATVARRLNDNDEHVRRAAVEVLGKRPSLSEEIVVAVRQRLTDNNKDARRTAVEVLGKRPSLSNESLEAVMQRLNDDDEHVRRAAVEVLGKRPSLSDECLAAVVRRLDDYDGRVVRAVVEVLERQLSLSDQILAVMVQRLKVIDYDKYMGSPTWPTCGTIDNGNVTLTLGSTSNYATAGIGHAEAVTFVADGPESGYSHLHDVHHYNIPKLRFATKTETSTANTSKALLDPATASVSKAVDSETESRTTPDCLPPSVFMQCPDAAEDVPDMSTQLLERTAPPDECSTRMQMVRSFVPGEEHLYWRCNSTNLGASDCGVDSDCSDLGFGSGPSSPATTDSPCTPPTESAIDFVSYATDALFILDAMDASMTDDDGECGNPLPSSPKTACRGSSPSMQAVAPVIVDEEPSGLASELPQTSPVCVLHDVPKRPRIKLKLRPTSGGAPCSAIDQPPSVLSTPTATALPRVRITLKTGRMALDQDAEYKTDEGQSHKKRRILLKTR